MYGLVTYFFVEIDGKQFIKVRYISKSLFPNINILQLQKQLMTETEPFHVLSKKYYENVDKWNRDWQTGPVSYEKFNAARVRYLRLNHDYQKCCFPSCDSPTPTKCNKCRHYVCSQHSPTCIHHF